MYKILFKIKRYFENKNINRMFAIFWSSFFSAIFMYKLKENGFLETFANTLPVSVGQIFYFTASFLIILFCSFTIAPYAKKRA